ncbi:DUF3710 domain-containing protein [Mycetocola manganoxydans]|uniref:DUF3710 domain-containing protein n=1 Tax=Mycetocola manganoxydans TaxID=699879 RepID=A0A3L6ZZH1_9MICO|nr:DUF3710 domain-containing protein [Mycetocola manganoxydans]GHD39679.1 hypothetical protein GCM10008097_02660 [Mycetocola manganoxydans]
MSRKSKQKKQDEIDLTESTVGTDVDAVDATTELDSVEPEELGTDLSKSAPEDREIEGPLDEAEANSVRPYIDLGGVKILPREGLNLRLEIEESTKRIVAVGLDYAGSTLQVQPFAAPRSTGLWNETRVQIQEQIAKQGGTATERDGVFGPELVAEVPVVQGTDGAAGMRIARFVGVDGPRWFLRGVIAGEGATNPEAAAKVEDLFRSIVVVRGSAPMPPRDLIPLKMPASATPTA